MSGLFGAIGQGLSAAGYAAGDMYAKQALMEAQSESDTQRALRLAEFKERFDIAAEDRKASRENASRMEQTARIDAKAGELADAAVGEKRGLIDAGIADKSAWTAEQQAAVDQALGLDKKAVAQDWRTRERAAVATGDISPEKAAGIERDQRRLDIADAAGARKEASDERRDATARYIAEMKDETAQKRIEALLARTGSSKDGTREALSFIDGVRKDLASEAANLKAMYQADIKDLSSSKREAVKKEYQPKFDAIEVKRDQIEQDFSALREKVGLPAIKGATPKAEAKPETKPNKRPPLSQFQK